MYMVHMCQSAPVLTLLFVHWCAYSFISTSVACRALVEALQVGKRVFTNRKASSMNWDVNSAGAEGDFADRDNHLQPMPLAVEQQHWNCLPECNLIATGVLHSDAGEQPT